MKNHQVFCLNNGEPTDPSSCNGDDKPYEDDDCNEQSCDADDSDEASGDGSGDGSGSGEAEEEAESEPEEKEEEEELKGL